MLVYILQTGYQHVILGDKSPYEVPYNERPKYEIMRTFECLVMAAKPNNEGDKFHAILVLSSNSKGV